VGAGQNNTPAQRAKDVTGQRHTGRRQEIQVVDPLHGGGEFAQVYLVERQAKEDEREQDAEDATLLQRWPPG
jgi:hypothetical protein